MASQKDIELILKARVDQGDSLSQAQSMAKSMADALENAFNGVGERIADKILREMQGKFGGLDLFSNYESPHKGARVSGSRDIIPGAVEPQVIPSPSTPTYGNDLSSNVVNQLNKSAATGLGFKHYKVHNLNDIMSGGHERQSQYHDPYNHGLMSSLNKRLSPHLIAQNETLNPDPSHLADMSNINKKEAIKADQVINNLRQYQNLKDIGANVDIKTFAKDSDIKGAQAFVDKMVQGAADRLVTLNDTIAELKSAILDNTDATKKEQAEMKAEGYDPESEEQRKNFRKKKQMAAEKEHDDISENTDELSNRKKQLDKFLPGRKPNSMERLSGWFNENQGLVRGATATLGAIGFGSHVMSERHHVERMSQAGQARLQEYGARDFNNGDYSSMMATEMLGGEDLMRQEATSNVNYRLRRDRAAIAATAIGGVAAGAAIGSTVIGAPVGAVVAGGALLGAAYQGYEYHKNVKNKAGLIEADMRNASAATKENYQLMADAYNASRSSAGVAFGTAKAVGSDSLTNMMMANGSEAGIAARAGLSHAELVSTRATLSGGTGGGVFYNPETRQNEGMMHESSLYKETERRLLNLQGSGFQNAANVAASYYQGGAGSYRATDSVDHGYNVGKSNHYMMDTYVGLRASGVEQMQAQQVMTASANIAGQSSYSRSAGQHFAERIGAGLTSSGRQNDPAYMNALMKAEERRSGDLRKDGGFEESGRYEQLTETQKKAGTTFTKADRLKLHKFGADWKSLQGAFERGSNKDAEVELDGKEIKASDMTQKQWEQYTKQYKDGANNKIDEKYRNFLGEEHMIYRLSTEDAPDASTAQDIADQRGMASPKSSKPTKKERDQFGGDEESKASGVGGDTVKVELEKQAALLQAGAKVLKDMMPAVVKNLDQFIAKMDQIAKTPINGLGVPWASSPQGTAPTGGKDE